MSQTTCAACGGTNTTYQVGSGGQEYWCSDCQSSFPYEDGTRPPRVQLMADGNWDELHRQLDEHFATATSEKNETNETSETSERGPNDELEDG